MPIRDDYLTPAIPGAPQARARRLAVGLAAAVLLLGALPWTSAEAQQRRARTSTLKVDDGASASQPIPQRTGFNLFAEEDLAGTGMRMTGTYGWSIPNVGPCPFYYLDNNNPQTCALLNTPNQGSSESFFEIGLLGGAPISEFRKIRAIHPGINNMRPPLGYTAAYTEYLVTPVARRWGPGDGQFGNYYSGVTSTSDGTCRDHTSFLSGSMPSSFTLTAGSDCPATWAGAEFGGKKPLIADSVLAYAQRTGGANFRFDEFRMPAAVTQDLGATAIGDFATYGLISDSYREILQRFGGVTPRGSGPSSERGYPLGLDIRYDAFQFSRPSVRNVVYYQLTIVNNSARVYGTGISYDSLYIGLHPGLLMGGPQAASWYFDYSRNAIIMVGGNTSGNCSSTYPRRVAGIATSCVNTSNFNDGANAFVFLKSPLGDMRNKLFTRPTSPFSKLTGVPANILDDTITFNHAHRAGFGALYNATTARNDKALFGYLSSIEDVFLDGRSITADFTAAQIWQLFQNENFKNYTGTLTADLARFNRFVPGATLQPNTPKNPNPGQPYGKWDYNNDGVQDTIFVPGCGSAGCHDIYSDTVASGMNNIVSNVGNVVGIGPYKLAAGDTTQLLIAFVGAGDRGTFDAQLNASIENYLNFYAGPSPVPPPTFEPEDIDIVPATVRDTTVGAANTLIRMRIDQAPVRIDPFIQSVYERIRTSTDPNVVRIRTLNPNLLTQIQDRINIPQNYAELLVFKSCDRGQTFTVSAGGSADCTPAPAVGLNGQPIGFGWRPWARIPVNPATGQLATSFVTDIVRSGRTYLYSFVTRTRGLIDIPIVDSIGGVIRGTNLAAALNIDADTIGSPLARSGPSTVIAYAPISLPAGVRTATLDTATLSGSSTTRVTAAAIGTTQSGRYRVYFANRFIVTTVVDTTKNAATTTVVAQRVVRRGAVASGTSTGTATDSLVVSSATFTGPGFIVTDGTVTIPENRVSASGANVTYIDTVTVAAADTAGYIIARDSAGNTKPFFLSTRSRSSSSVNAGTTTAFRESRDFPGFTLSFEGPQATVSTPRLSRVVRAPGDTIDPNVVANNGVVVLAGQTRYLTLGGRYEFTYSDDAFGPNSPFTFGTPDSLQAQVTRSLQARNDVTTADTTSTTLALIKTVETDTSITNRPLIPARFPFTVRTANGQPATLAMFRRYRAGSRADTDSTRNNSRLLGNGGDTIRVTIPSLQWVPGDTIYVIETALRDSTVGTGTSRTTIVKDSTINGQTVRVPIQVPTKLVAGRFVLTCSGTATVPVTTASPRCNPLVTGTFAATGYLAYRNGWMYVAEFPRSFDLFSELRVDATGRGAGNYQLTANDVSVVRVVPNPYVVQSNLDDITGNRVGIPRVMFTNVPLQGMLRVYSVSGQLMQQLSWTAADLQTSTTGQTSGDLPFILRTREGLDMGSGLYLYVLTATGPGSNGQVARGKFVIIR